MLKAINLSALAAKEIKQLPDDTVLISINVPDEPVHELQLDRDDIRILTISFWDITAKSNYKGNWINPIDGDIAMRIINFIRYWKHKNFIIHCQAGISRSAAVAMFIHLMYGHTLKEHFYALSHPNPYVLGKLFLLHDQMPQEDGVTMDRKL